MVTAVSATHWKNLGSLKPTLALHAINRVCLNLVLKHVVSNMLFKHVVSIECWPTLKRPNCLNRLRLISLQND